MSFRIIRGAGRVQKLKVSLPGEAKALSGSHEHVMDVEKQAFEQGYAEGERIGKEMGEKMVETIVKRYDHAIARLAETHKALADSMEEEIVRLALAISRKIVYRVTNPLRCGSAGRISGEFVLRLQQQIQRFRL
ncbi:MAG: hypothetical protein DMG17_01365 [Acidobacteria bacterium]|nr:MAG: hypothetical protein DMG17_01365 [Acidobacteriota bacterium]